MSEKETVLKIGWAQGDVTPTDTVYIVGQFHARVSEGIQTPLTTTALALESDNDHAILVSCDYVSISEPLRDRVRARLEGVEGLDPMKVVMNGTHTHTGPQLRFSEADGWGSDCGVDLPVMPIPEYVDFAADRIADTVKRAWAERAPGKIAYGMGFAVVGRNRRAAYADGTSQMYGKTAVPEFTHIEGYEDHSVNLLATSDADGNLTGIAVNIPCPSQVSEHEFFISADYWHETRQEIRDRLGEDLFILPQCSAAGDQSPRPIYEKAAYHRMLELRGRTERDDIAQRIAEAVTDTLEAIAPTFTDASPLAHQVTSLDVPVNAIPQAEVAESLREAENFRKQYETLKSEIDAHPEMREKPRWYVEVTRTYRRMKWYAAVAARAESQKAEPTMAVELHVIRLGDVAFATNPFEYYLDFGVRIKARSAAMQTFLVQLAGNGSYVPSPRSVAGGGYGSMAASNPVGAEGGRAIAEYTITTIENMWNGE